MISPQHTFRQLAETINTAFARWDLGHLYAFTLEDGTRIGLPDLDDDPDERKRIGIACPGPRVIVRAVRKR